MQATKEANRRRLEAKWARASPFKLRVTERPTHLERIRQEIEADLARQLTFKPPKPSPVPAAPTAPVSGWCAWNSGTEAPDREAACSL
jgi:hypothetical protein